jgi:uncharacterized protein YaaQ
MSPDMMNAVCRFGSEAKKKIDKALVDGKNRVAKKTLSKGSKAEQNTKLLMVLENQLSTTAPVSDALSVSDEECSDKGKKKKQLSPQSTERKRIQQSCHLMVSCGCGEVDFCVAQQIDPRRGPRMTHCAGFPTCQIRLEEGCRARHIFCYKCRQMRNFEPALKPKEDPYPSVNKGTDCLLFFLSFLYVC